MLFLACAPILLLLVMPSLIIVPMALDQGRSDPVPTDLDLAAFLHRLSGDPRWVASTLLSFKISMLAVAIGAFTGSTAAIAMHERHFPGRNLVSGSFCRRSSCQ